MFTEKDRRELAKLYDEAANISPEAVEYLNKNRTFVRKGEICRRSVKTLRDKLYQEYPQAKIYEDDDATKAIDDIAAAALKKAKSKEKAKEKAAEARAKKKMEKQQKEEAEAAQNTENENAVPQE